MMRRNVLFFALLSLSVSLVGMDETKMKAEKRSIVDLEAGSGILGYPNYGAVISTSSEMNQVLSTAAQIASEVKLAECIKKSLGCTNCSNDHLAESIQQFKALNSDGYQALLNHFLLAQSPTHNQKVPKTQAEPLHKDTAQLLMHKIMHLAMGKEADAHKKRADTNAKKATRNRNLGGAATTLGTLAGVLLTYYLKNCH